MHLTLILLTTSAAALARAQVNFNTSTYQFVCPSTPPNGAYCTGPSLSSDIIIRCNGTAGVAGNCNDNLAGVPPIGVKLFAPCYETSLTAGDAACSYGGIVYPDLGASFPVPGPGSSNGTAANASSAALTTSAASNVSLSLTALTSLSTSTSILYATSPAPAVAGYTALADLATLSSAPYPISSATNASALAVGTVTAPSKTDGSGAMFTGAAGRTKGHTGAVIANLVANAIAFGLVLLL